MITPAVGSIQKDSALRRGKAMSSAPSISGTTKFAMPGEGRDDEQEDHDRRVRRDQAVVGVAREVLVARRRELRAEGLGEHAADQEEHERRDQVLDPDHLVVRVDLEVVAPAVGAVVGVPLGQLRADDVLRPVVEAADAGDEAERHESIRQVETTSYWNHGQPIARRTSDGIATAMTAAMIDQISARHQPGRVRCFHRRRRPVRRRVRLAGVVTTLIPNLP